MGITKINFYRDQPLFGLDIGHSSMKIMQLDKNHGKKPQVLGYGVSNYYPENAISNGVIVNYEVLAHTMRELFSDRLIGSITTKRVACTVPTSHTFSRPMTLPAMDKEDIDDAVKLEAEQYIPIPIDNLYIDYDVSRQDDKNIDLLVVATPKTIVDSSIKFLESVGFEPVALEPTMNAATRLFSMADVAHNEVSLIVDFGSVAVDVAVFDQTMLVNSTVSGGSDTLTNLIAKQLGITASEAYVIKSQYGIGNSDKAEAIKTAAKPILDPLIREIRKTMRYYDERMGRSGRKINQIITTGGGATMRGLDEFITQQLGLPARRLDPWHNIEFGELQPPSELARSMYITVAGEAILSTEEIFE